MPTSWRALRALLIAAAFSPEQLAKVCQTAFGCDLAAITSSQDATQQAEAITAYAVRYDLLRELADVVLSASADRPAVQNLLLSDDMQNDPPNGGQATTYNMLRMESRLDGLTQQVQSLAAEIAALRSGQSSMQQELTAMRGNHSTSPGLNWNIIIVALIIAGVAVVVTYFLPRIGVGA